MPIPQGVKSIDDGAFYKCTGLTSFDIPNSVTSIGQSAFAETSFTRLEIPSHITELGIGVFQGCPNLEYVKINGQVKNLENYMFQDCVNLRKVELPESIIHIYGYVFSNCESLEEVNLDNITLISSFAFQNCKKLTSVNLPKIETLFTEVFSGCTDLRTVSLGSRIKEFTTGDRHGGSTYVFKGCENLEDFYCYAETVPKTGGGDFSGAYIEYATLHVPSSAIEAYRSASPWKDFGKIVAIDDTAIKDLKASAPASDSPYFTLGGIRTTQPKRGLYIKDGKKVILK